MERPQHISQDNCVSRAAFAAPKAFRPGRPVVVEKREIDATSAFPKTQALSGSSITVHEYQRHHWPGRDFGSGLYRRLRLLAMSSSIRNAIDIRQRLYESVRCFARRGWYNGIERD
jgi:hypothetical protein